MTSQAPGRAAPGRGPASRWELMSEAVRAFAEATDSLEHLVSAIAQHMGSAVGATCLIRLLSDDGRFLNPSGLWSAQPQLEPILRRTVAAAPVRVRVGTPAYEALRSDETIRLTRVALADLGVDLRTEHEHLRPAINPGPLLLVALRSRERAYGLVYLIRIPGEPGFDGEEEALVNDLVDQAAVALGNSLRIRSLQTENATFRSSGDGATDRRVERLDALATLAAGLAHDYDNLISVIRMCTNLRLEALSNDDPLRTQLDEVRQACERAADLTPLLSVLAQRQVLQPELIDIVDVLQQLTPSLEQLLGSAGKLHADLREGGRPVCVDRPQFAEAVTHLVLNARNALGPNVGRVRLLAETRVIADDDLIGVSPGTYAVVSIDDDGIGMDPELAARAARPFYSQWADERSSGLGLTIVLAFARQSGGTVTVASRPQQGTTVSLFLPVVGDQLPDDSQPRHTLDGIETILLAVGDLGYRSELRGVLRRHGYQVLDVQTSRQAIDVARTFEEPIHLIVVDIGATELTATLARMRPESAWLAAGRGSDPTRQLSRGQQESEILARMRWALAEKSAGLTDKPGQ